jgi:HAE1 family hydrophobic/amphiphilic exporter-1
LNCKINNRGPLIGGGFGFEKQFEHGPLISTVAPKRGQNLSSIDAMTQACLIRFRPIMMTTLAAILATLPIALRFGAGAEARRSLGIAVVGGLVFSQFLTLYLTPAFYMSMERLTQRWEERKEQHQGMAG